MRKFESIIRIGKIKSDLNNGELIHVSEKLDGANASFLIDDNGQLHTFSRNNEITITNELKGFNHWVENNIDATKLKPGYIYYGEWLIKHKISYEEKYMKNFYLFDIFDINKDQYLKPEEVEKFASELNVSMPKCFYYGRLKSLHDIEQFVGQSTMAKEGEGIVIRNLTNGMKIKWVNDKFAELKIGKEKKLENPKVIELCDMLLTDNRLEKILHKGRDENQYETFEKKNFGKIMKFVCNTVIEDIIKEEDDLIPVDLKEEFINKSKKLIPKKVQQILV